MASSEMSSSDIFQGQGFYNDGGNEAAGIPPLHTPVAPAQVPIDADEGIWKKYSAHYEFPLSLVIALGIHLIAILLVIGFMAIRIHWDQPKVPPGELVILEGPRFDDPDARNKPPHAGGGSGNAGENSTDPFVPPFDPRSLESPDKNFSVNPTDIGPITPRFNQPLDQKTQPRLQGKSTQGTGQGPDEGPGIGKGKGVGVDMGRNKRWNIRLHYDEPEALLAQLANLQCIVAGRVNSGRYLVFRQLASTQPGQFDVMTGDAFGDFVNGSKKLWFASSDRNTSENFAYAVQCSERILSLVIVIPQEMERAILAAELKYHKMTEDEVRTRRLVTTFNVVRQGTQWNVEVIGSKVLPAETR
ncbi:MAG: hypothetical protein U0796_17520 [Gemmatales bacterium]